jgi:hypothetical protein
MAYFFDYTSLLYNSQTLDNIHRRMRNNNLEQFVKLRRELSQEKEQLTRRLAQINDALGEVPSPSLAAISGVTEEKASPSAPARRAAISGRAPAGGGTSLRELVVQVLREGPKTKEEVLEAVQQLGYRFQTNNPLNSLGVILYGRSPKLNRVEGRFSLPGKGGGAVPKSGGGKRQMSAAARERIAEAQRKRWAATRKGQAGAGATATASPKSSSPKRQISAAGRKAIAEAARRRWAAAKAAGRSNL